MRASSVGSEIGSSCAHTITQFVDITKCFGIYQPSWASRPGLFTVLRWIHKEDIMGSFIAKDLTDWSLPLSYSLLPLELGDARPQFEKLQELVWTSAKEIELGIYGRHMNLKSGEEHFVRQKYLGSDGSGEVHEVWSRLSHRSYALTGSKGKDCIKRS